MKLFVSQDWPSRNEVTWTHRFADALRAAGFDVFQEWSFPKPPPANQVEDELRASDGIVFVVTSPESLRSMNLGFLTGVARAGDNPAIVVLSRNLDAGQLPVPELRSRAVTKRSPQRTAAAVAEILRTFDWRRVA